VPLKVTVYRSGTAWTSDNVTDEFTVEGEVTEMKLSADGAMVFTRSDGSEINALDLVP
jgi:hypothetical protein